MSSLLKLVQLLAGLWKVWNVCCVAQSSQTHLKKKKSSEKADLKIKLGLTWNLTRQYWPQHKAARFSPPFFPFFPRTLLIDATDLKQKTFRGLHPDYVLNQSKNLPKAIIQIFELCTILFESSDCSFLSLKTSPAVSLQLDLGFQVPGIDHSLFNCLEI